LLNFGAKGRVVNATPWRLYLQQRDPIRILQGLVEFQRWSGRVRSISPPTGFEFPTVHAVPIHCQLLYPDALKFDCLYEPKCSLMFSSVTKKIKIHMWHYLQNIS
jgi:hypothetical protein